MMFHKADLDIFKQSSIVCIVEQNNILVTVFIYAKAIKGPPYYSYFFWKWIHSLSQGQEGDIPQY